MHFLVATSSYVVRIDGAACEARGSDKNLTFSHDRYQGSEDCHDNRWLIGSVLWNEKEKDYQVATG